MTIKDTILSFPGLAGFNSAYLSQLLKARSLDGASESTVGTVREVNLAIADSLKFAVNMPDFTENKLSMKYPRSYFIETARQLYRENGEPEKADALHKKTIKMPRGKAPLSW